MTEKNGVGFLLLGLLAPQARAQDDPRASSAQHHAAATGNGPVKIVRESTERFHDVQKSAVRDDQIKRDAPITSAPRAASRMRVGVSGESTHRSGVSTRDPTRPQRHRATPFDRLQRREGASTRSSGASASFRHARRRPRLPRATAGVRAAEWMEQRERLSEKGFKQRGAHPNAKRQFRASSAILRSFML